MAARALSPSSSFKSNSSPTRESAVQEVYAALGVPEPGVRLLALDDGGIRGISMLLLLRGIFNRIQRATGLPSPPLPCEYFDIIAGSGTGGFIALLLGRLRLSIENAIECYTRVVSQVFSQIKVDGSFKTTPFEKVLKEICDRFGDGEDTPIQENPPIQCKTFVCARESRGAGNVVFRKLRTYTHPTERSVRCTLLEAVRATMGHSVFFKPLSVTKENSSTTLLDAGDDHYNPVVDLYEEAESLYPSRRIAYFLSLGAGKSNTVGCNPSRRFANKPRLPEPALAALRHLADRCDSIASAFQAQHADLHRIFVRLTPTDDSYDGSIRWENVESLEDFILPYLLVVDKQLQMLVIAMRTETALVASSRRLHYDHQTRSWC
ncbi:acyl transferase/acyl hydrolase/lysophospholipase [Schizophyllum amplum]|uniref:Acyl transferase/acyl hydrolase/lysophospholipase n=1 Tax=Schizophyllum amplum TaxID=97359 RepID=A0A550C368_9AGAR|nr:acyl transferase/acyl hydrolase/lysophospholipase [Auriculariopsis ampla]